MSKENKYILDKNGIPLKCCFEGMCDNYATRDIGNPFLKGNDHIIIPICDKHKKFLKDGEYWFVQDIENKAIYRPYKELPER